MSNIGKAKRLLDHLYSAGVRTVLSCAGARNSPLVTLLQQDDRFESLAFFDERSAGFFALGRAKASGEPVVVCTTSGTAVAELLPSVVEAHYSGVPLLLLTADRPPEYRGTGAPQSIEQVGIFGGYVERCEDLVHEEACDLANWSRKRPWHINVCFGEPLIDEAISEVPLAPRGRCDYTEKTGKLSFDALDAFLEKSDRPLVILGELSPEESLKVGTWLRELGAPIYAEGLSQLRGREGLGGLTIRAGERLIQQACDRGQIDGILRIGGVPTLRLWRDLEGSLSQLRVLSISSRPFTGLSRGQLLYFPEGEGVLEKHSPKKRGGSYLNELMQKDSSKREQVEQLFRDYPKAEPSLINSLAKRLSEGALVYLGNSMPVREWDLAVQDSALLGPIMGNRGANGIDGQLSSFLGMVSATRDNIAILGDLTTLYDLSSLWALRYLEKASIAIVIINNGGGRIFDRVFGHEKFRNTHDIRFEGWAKQWRMDYEAWDSIPEKRLIAGRKVIEIHPREAQTKEFWEALSQIWKE